MRKTRKALSALTVLVLLLTALMPAGVISAAEANAPTITLPPVMNRLTYTITRGDCDDATSLPTASADWPLTPPELKTQYIWNYSEALVEVKTEFDYHHRAVMKFTEWPDKRPDLVDDESVVQNITQWYDLGRAVAFDQPTYLYFVYYDQPGFYPFACYGVLVQPVRAAVTGAQLTQEQPVDGFLLSDTVTLKPEWSVGILNGEEFTVLPELSGCPADGAVQWGIRGNSQAAVVDAERNVTHGNDAATLIPPEAGGTCTYTATTANTNPNEEQRHWMNLYVPADPAEIEVVWAQEAQYPIESAPDAAFKVDIVPNPDGTGQILTGIPMGLASSNITHVGDFLRQIVVPAGTRAVVRSSSGELMADNERMATGCSVEVVDAAGATTFSVTAVIRGDVLGSGVLDMAQLIRLARANNDSRPLSGPYLDAAYLLTDSDSINVASLIALARMLHSAD